METIKWKKLKIVMLAALGLVLLLGVAGYLYALGFDLDGQPPADPGTQASDLAFVRDVGKSRGRVLAVVTSTATIGDSGKQAGFELTELARAYYVFVANGFDVDIASPRGGKPPMQVDDGLVEADYAFLNDAQARRKLDRSVPLAKAEAADYAAVYFVGGKGTMFDFADNADIQRIVRTVYEAGGIVGAVCHGPAALLNVRIGGDGRHLVAGRRMTGFTNAEELFLLKDARQLFPYLLQDRLVERGARFVEGPIYLDTTAVDGRLVTGQNPWSTWSVAEAMVTALGHVPVPRERTGEEIGVQLLGVYYRHGPAAAARARARWPQADRRLLLMHALVASMQGRWRDAYHLQGLARP